MWVGSPLIPPQPPSSFPSQTAVSTWGKSMQAGLKRGRSKALLLPPDHPADFCPKQQPPPTLKKSRLAGLKWGRRVKLSLPWETTLNGVYGCILFPQYEMVIAFLQACQLILSLFPRQTGWHILLFCRHFIIVSLIV